MHAWNTAFWAYVAAQCSQIKKLFTCWTAEGDLRVQVFHVSSGFQCKVCLQSPTEANAGLRSSSIPKQRVASLCPLCRSIQHHPPCSGVLQSSLPSKNPSAPQSCCRKPSPRQVAEVTPSTTTSASPQEMTPQPLSLSIELLRSPLPTLSPFPGPVPALPRPQYKSLHFGHQAQHTYESQTLSSHSSSDQLVYRDIMWTATRQSLLIHYIWCSPHLSSPLLPPLLLLVKPWGQSMSTHVLLLLQTMPKGTSVFLICNIWERHQSLFHDRSVCHVYYMHPISIYLSLTLQAAKGLHSSPSVLFYCVSTGASCMCHSTPETPCA